METLAFLILISLLIGFTLLLMKWPSKKMNEREFWLNELKNWQHIFNGAINNPLVGFSRLKVVSTKRDECLLNLLNPPNARSHWRLLANRYYNLAQQFPNESVYFMKKYQEALDRC